MAENDYPLRSVHPFSKWTLPDVAKRLIFLTHPHFVHTSLTYAHDEQCSAFFDSTRLKKHLWLFIFARTAEGARSMLAP